MKSVHGKAKFKAQIELHMKTRKGKAFLCVKGADNYHEFQYDLKLLFVVFQSPMDFREISRHLFTI